MQRIFWSAGQPLFVYIKFETHPGTPQPESFNIHRLLFTFNVSSDGERVKKKSTHATRATMVATISDALYHRARGKLRVTIESISVVFVVFYTILSL